MRCILAIAFAVVLVVAEGKVLPSSDVENQQTSTQIPNMADYIREAQTAMNNLRTQIQDKFNLSPQNQDEWLNTLKEHSNNFATNVQQFFHNMTEEMNKNPELENIWTNFKNKVNEAIDKINVDQETTDQLNQLRAKFREGVESLMTESENAAKTIHDNSDKIQQDVAKFTKDAVDMAVQTVQNLNNQLQHAAAPA